MPGWKLYYRLRRLAGKSQTARRLHGMLRAAPRNVVVSSNGAKRIALSRGQFDIERVSAMETLTAAAERERDSAATTLARTSILLREDIVSHSDLILRRLAEVKQHLEILPLGQGRSTAADSETVAALEELVRAAQQERDAANARLSASQAHATEFATIQTVQLRAEVVAHADLLLRRLEELKAELIEVYNSRRLGDQGTFVDRVEALEALSNAAQRERDIANGGLAALRAAYQLEKASAADRNIAVLSSSFASNADLVLRRLDAAHAANNDILRLIASNIIAARTTMAGANSTTSPPHGSSFAAELYLNLLEDVLVDYSNVAARDNPVNTLQRSVDLDWPERALTMIGSARMRNIRQLLSMAIAEGIPGDIIETGAWRGGACIYARAILRAYGDQDCRTVYVADSFRGLPKPDQAIYPADAGDKHFSYDQLAVSRSEVEENFKRFGLLDERVVFLEGWFKDTLPSAPIAQLAMLRLDGDMYESTIQALDALYAKVVPGGFVIVDDYILGPCAEAVNDFRRKHKISAEMHDIDGNAVWWRVPK